MKQRGCRSKVEVKKLPWMPGALKGPRPEVLSSLEVSALKGKGLMRRNPRPPAPAGPTDRLCSRPEGQGHRG